jgi:hypothetical protein
VLKIYEGSLFSRPFTFFALKLWVVRKLHSATLSRFANFATLALATLSRFELPKIYWPKAYQADGYVLRRLPTNPVQGYMTPMEAVPGGQAPTLEYLKVWGCKAYALKTKADSRKDWKNKAQISYFTGYH